MKLYTQLLDLDEAVDRLGCPPLFIYSGVDFPLLSSEKTTGLWKKQKKSKIILDWSVPYPAMN